jgi:hypothetical protein
MLVLPLLPCQANHLLHYSQEFIGDDANTKCRQETSILRLIVDLIGNLCNSTCITRSDEVRNFVSDIAYLIFPWM